MELQKRIDISTVRGKISGHPNREVRFNLAARAFAESQLRNRMPSDGGAGCPVLVEGKRDKAALRALGFEGPIELINRPGYSGLGDQGSRFGTAAIR